MTKVISLFLPIMLSFYFSTANATTFNPKERSHSYCKSSKECVDYVTCRNPLFKSNLLNDAKNWPSRAFSFSEMKGASWDDESSFIHHWDKGGYFTLQKPLEGAAISLKSSTPEGHVAYIEEIIDANTIRVADANWGTSSDQVIVTTTNNWKTVKFRGSENLEVTGFTSPAVVWQLFGDEIGVNPSISAKNTLAYLTKKRNEDRYTVSLPSSSKDSKFRLAIPVRNYGVVSWINGAMDMKVINSAGVDFHDLISGFKENSNKIQPLNKATYIFEGIVPKESGSYNIDLGIRTSNNNRAFGRKIKLKFIVH